MPVQITVNTYCLLRFLSSQIKKKVTAKTNSAVDYLKVTYFTSQVL